MDFLKNLLTLTEERDESALTELQMKDIQKNIGKGAKDLDQDWANALELVHQAYRVSKIERPNPSMKSAWKQYETNLQAAVSQLSKARGMDGSWRMSAASLHEEVENMREFKVTLYSDSKEINQYSNIAAEDEIVTADDLDSAAEIVVKRLTQEGSYPDSEIRVDSTFKGKEITFWPHNTIRKNTFISITPI